MTYRTDLNLENQVSWEAMWKAPKGKVMLLDDPVTGIALADR
jgi:spermidine/putrescine-binding protein